MSKELHPPKGAIKNKKIVGRGIGSGRGKTSAKGHKGHKARAGGTLNLGFEGGQMKLVMRLPKIGFSNMPHKKKVAEISLDDLEKSFSEGETVSLKSLLEKKLIGKNIQHAKVLGGGELKKKLALSKEVRISAGAKKVLESAGGTVEAAS